MILNNSSWPNKPAVVLERKEMFNVKYENGKLRLETDDIAIEYSNPQMIPYEEKESIKDLFNDWLYFYYNVDIYAKNESEMKDGWTKIFGIRTWDEPTLPSLCESLTILVDSKDMGKEINESGEFLQEQSYEDGILNEDTYIVKKYSRIDENGNINNWYWLNIGLYKSQDVGGLGITFCFLYEEEILKLIGEIISFLKYAKKIVKEDG